MNWLNYHHLMYFWTMAREGSVSRAADKLHLSQPTISGQLRQLENAVGCKLYERIGRELRLTDTGKIVYEYAEEIFTTGQELMHRLNGRQTEQSLIFTVGIPDFVSKLIAYRLIEPVFHLSQPVQLVCYEGKLPELLTDLAMHRLDLVLSDSPAESAHLAIDRAASAVGRYLRRRKNELILPRGADAESPHQEQP